MGRAKKSLDDMMAGYEEGQEIDAADVDNADGWLDNDDIIENENILDNTTIPNDDTNTTSDYSEFLRVEYPKLYPTTLLDSRGLILVGNHRVNADELDTCVHNYKTKSKLRTDKWAVEYFEAHKEQLLKDIENWGTEEARQAAYAEYKQKQAAFEHKFWWMTKKGLLQIDELKMADYIAKLGYAYITVGKTGTRTLVHIDKYLVREVKHQDMLTAIVQSVRKFFPEDAGKVWSKLVSQSGSALLNTLPTRTDVTFIKDTRDKAYYPFLNGVAIVTSTGISLVDDFKDGYFWESQVCQTNLDLDSQYVGDWSKFLENIGDKANDSKRYDCLTTSIGYLLHNYQDNAGGRAIIVTEDTPPSVNSNGRTGKSLIATSLSYLRKVQLLEGRTATPARMQDKFVFQTVQPDTRVVNYDDANRNFPLELLFTALTQGITIERKNQTPLVLSLQDTPKFIITTNFSIGGVDPSSLARRHDVEIHAYYGAEKQYKCPREEFKRNFWGEEWDEQEWNSFYLTMLRCVQQYLLRGLVYNLTENAKAKRLTANVPFIILNHVQEIMENVAEEGKIVLSSTDVTNNAKDAKIIPDHYVKLLKVCLNANGYQLDIQRIQAGGVRQRIYTASKK